MVNVHVAIWVRQEQDCGLWLCSLMPLSTTFQLYRGGQEQDAKNILMGLDYGKKIEIMVLPEN